ncbi:MAG TPA: HlyD family type I secretion periplasmic adaptor subunit [Chromatiales bacterium]|nr:HlyD family type I secretion periplasmic adaptor subunit [Chromatiales bacterium]
MSAGADTSRPSGPAEAVSSGDLDFVTDAALAVRERTPHGARLILWFTLLFVLVFLFWASRAKIDEVTKGQGKVIPSSQVQVVQNLEGGILAELLVAEGETVEQGQVLLRIDDTRFASSLRESRLRYLALLAKATRLKAETEGLAEMPEMPAEVREEAPEIGQREARLFSSRRRELQAAVGILQQQVAQRRQEIEEQKAKRTQLSERYKLAERELKLTRPLMEQGAVSEVEVLRLQRQVSELKGELAATRYAIQRARSRIDEAERKVREQRLSFRNKAREQLNEVLAELAQISESAVALEDRVRRTEVKSPVRGTVKRLMVNTLGGVIKPGAELVEIVPLEDTLLVEAHIRPRDIAFIGPHQPATVKLTAYDFAIYGGLEAEVEHISADTITNERGESYYLVRVRTKRNHLGDDASALPIIPGMLAEVDILTGKKTILDYLLKPVMRARYQALRER